jgi:hypothetical protein
VRGHATVDLIEGREDAVDVGGVDDVGYRVALLERGGGGGGRRLPDGAGGGRGVGCRAGGQDERCRDSSAERCTLDKDS